MKRIIFALTIAITLSACQSTNYESKGKFLINDNRQVIAPAQLSEISKSWKSDIRLTFGKSKTDAGTVAWIADLIALSEAQGTEGIGRCNVLTAVDLKSLQLKPFAIYDAVKRQPRKYSPVQYYEAWVVDACGKQHEWRVFDDPADPRNPLTVLLWSAS